MTSRIDWPRVTATALGVLAGLVATTGTFAVTAAGFTLSFDAIRKVGIAAGIRFDWAWQLPVSVDGAMAVATVTAVVMSRLKLNPTYPWIVVISGAAISIACNAVHATMRDQIELDDNTAMAVSAIPAVMLALSVHLLVVLVNAAADSAKAKLTSGTDKAPEKPQVTAAVNLPSVSLPAPATVAVAPPVAVGEPDTAPATAPAKPAAPRPAITRTVPRPAPAKAATDTATRVAKLRQQRPDITQKAAAAELEISERTAARYWSAGVGDSPAETAKTNGHSVPDLITTGEKP